MGKGPSSCVEQHFVEHCEGTQLAGMGGKAVVVPSFSVTRLSNKLEHINECE